MKYQPLKHRTLWLVALIIGLITLLGLLSGAGYVLVVWLGWQVQTSATVFMLLLFAVILGVAYAIRSINHWIKNWYLRHPGKIEHYRQLLPFEQLGCLWLLNAKTSKQQEIEAIFNQSASLRQLVKAHLLRENAQLEQAAHALNQGSALTDLLVLEQIELHIAAQQYDQAQAALTALGQQPVSAFAQSLNPAWNNAIQELWAKLLIAQPWILLQIDPPPVLTLEQHYHWLLALQQQLAEFSADQQLRLIEYYQAVQAQPEFWQNMTSARQWLLVLNQISKDKLIAGQQALQQHSLIELRQQLADQLLRQEFDPRILTIWLQNQLQQGNVDCQHFTQRLEELAQRYPGQPSIAMAQWHQLKADQQNEAAQDILQNWQHHPEFSYLRLKEALADQPQQMADLDIIYEHLKR
jgi:hypothetical protein